MRMATVVQLKLKISGMTCSGCAENIRASLEREPGIEDVQINPMTGVGTVTFDPSRVSEERILGSKIFSGQYRARVLR